LKKPTTPKSEKADLSAAAAAKPRVAGIVDGQTISHLRRERGDEDERAQAPLSFALIRRLLGFTGAYRRKMIALFITVALRGIQIPVLAWGVGAVIKRGAGTLVLNGSNAHAGGTVVEQGELVIRHVAALGSGRLEVRAGGRVTLDLGLDGLAVPSLVLDAAGRIDIGAGRLTVAAGLAESALRLLLLAGHNGGGWDGDRGFVSRAAMLGRTVGYVIDQGLVTIAYAVPGDTNLDGVVDVIDVVNLVNNFNAPSGDDVGWSGGDFNYDGMVDQLDLSDFLGAAAFDQGPYLSAADAAFASLVSERT
jgi:autotransporter-associated beta strand protein